MLSDYKLKIADLYNISIGNVKKLVHNTSCIRIQSIYGKELKNMELKIWKRAEKLLKIEFYTKPVYGDNDKYIKTKTKIHAGSMNNNARFYCQSKKSIFLKHFQKNANMSKKKDKNGELY